MNYSQHDYSLLFDECMQRGKQRDEARQVARRLYHRLLKAMWERDNAYRELAELRRKLEPSIETGKPFIAFDDDWIVDTEVINRRLSEIVSNY